MKHQSSRTHRIITFALLASLSIFGNISLPTTVVANPKDEKQVVGQLSLVGAVTVNDKKAINGTTVFSNARLNVACASGSRATVNLGKLGRIELTPGSQMVLRFSDGLISGDLVMGRVVVNSASGVKVAINTPDGVSAADGKESSVLAVAAQRGVRCVPVMATSQVGSASTALGSGALAAILLGAGGTAVAGAVVSSQQASSPTP